MEYESHIFGSESVHIIDIQVSAADWEGLKKDALSKECIDSTVTIDDEELYHVVVRTKGNSGLLFNAAKGWDRFRLLLEFDAFRKASGITIWIVVPCTIICLTPPARKLICAMK